jgi:hypothetical protein
MAKKGFRTRQKGAQLVLCNAIAQLRHLGFTKLQNLAGGIDRWTTEVDPALPRY